MYEICVSNFTLLSRAFNTTNISVEKPPCQRKKTRAVDFKCQKTTFFSFLFHFLFLFFNQTHTLSSTHQTHRIVIGTEGLYLSCIMAHHITDFSLEVDMETFLDTFWYSNEFYLNYLKDNLLDKDISIGEWTIPGHEDEVSCKVRHVKSQHPCKVRRSKLTYMIVHKIHSS
jgi:hypothetical protein